MVMRTGFPVALANGTAVDTGVVLAGQVVRDVSGNPRAGVLPRTLGNLVSARSDLKVNVAPFEGVTSRAGQGVVWVANDATTQTAVLPVPTSNSWVVVVWFRHDDEMSPNTDPDSLPILGFTAGTAAPTPAKPSIPDGCVELATVLIPSTATATNSTGVTITNTFLFTAAAGGVVVCRNAAEQNAFSAGEGQVIYRQDLDLYRQRVTKSSTDSTLVWAPLGEVSVTQTASSLNPIPTSETTVGSSSLTFTLTTDSLCDFTYMGRITVLLGMEVNVQLRIDGSNVRNADTVMAGAGAQTINQAISTVLTAGSHTVSLRATASTANSAVLFEPSWSMTVKRNSNPLAT